MWDWLNDLTTWLKEQFLALWNGFVEFIQDTLLAALELVLNLFATAVEAIGVPDFLTTYSFDSLLGQAGGTIVWLAGKARLGDCLAVLAAAVAFRLLRKLFTLGQW